MRLHRFYISEKIGSKNEITVHSDELVNQISRVFRLKKGDSVILFDGSGFDFECTIFDFGESDEKVAVIRPRLQLASSRVVTLNVGKKEESRFMPVRDSREIILCAAVVKKDTFEWIVEKATELGVTRIIPVMAERSEKKNLNEARLKKIAIEASEQSGRGNVPEIHKILSLKEAIAWASKNNISATVFHTEGTTYGGATSIGAASVSTPVSVPVSIFIGPEGGWSPDEVEMFHKNNMPVVSLGNQVLRAETAVVAALSLVILGK